MLKDGGNSRMAKQLLAGVPNLQRSKGGRISKRISKGGRVSKQRSKGGRISKQSNVQIQFQTITLMVVFWNRCLAKPSGTKQTLF